MTIKYKFPKAFTLLELLVVIAIIAILAAIVIPAVSNVPDKSKRAACLNNLKQINLAVQLYADEHNDVVSFFTNTIYFDYKYAIASYLGNNTNTVFICRSDDFPFTGPLASWLSDFSPSGKGFCTQPWTRYSSYWFNGGIRTAQATNELGMAQKPFASVHQPTKTELIGEISGGIGLSTHSRKQPLQFKDAPNVMSFVDGHVAYIKIYWNGVEGFDGFPAFYEPTNGYDYKWTGN